MGRKKFFSPLSKRKIVREEKGQLGGEYKKNFSLKNRKSRKELPEWVETQNLLVIYQ